MWAPLVPQEIEYHAPVTLTGSLKVIETFESTGTLAGAVGRGRSRRRAAPGRRSSAGRARPMAKSAALLSVSVAPPPFRSAEVVLESVAVGAVSEQFAEP